MAIACVLDALISDSYAEAMLMLCEIRVNKLFLNWRGNVRQIFSSVICIKPYRGVCDLKVQMININVKKERAQQGPVRDPNFNRYLVRVNAVQFDPLPPILQIIPHQLQYLICKTIGSQLCKKQAVAHGVKRLTQVNCKRKNSLSVVKSMNTLGLFSRGLVLQMVK